jgi:hypothetical protein
MSTCLFLSFRFDTEPAAGETAKLDRLLRATAKLEKALLHSPAVASDPYVKDGAPPTLVLQLYFAAPPDLEAAVSRTGQLGALASPAEFPVLAKAEIVQQAMIVRTFAVPEPTFRTPPGESHCTYLVSYEGDAEDLNAWHAHYLERHTAHMARFPEIRELEVYTRLDWVSLQPWRRANYMQRNKVVFDSPAALDRALHSPVRHAMRADFNAFPKFSGPNRHYAMMTRAVALSRS